MEKQQPEHTEQESNAPANSGTPAAYFVLVKKAGGSSGTERSMVVAKQELGGIGCLLEKSNRLMPGTASHPFECHSGNVCVTLENQEMWNQFYKHGTEMVLTKRGRRMFPYCRFCLLGLDPLKKYILVMDIAPVDNQRYKWNGQWWELNGKAEPHVLGRVYIHPNSPSSGSYWMRQPISFHKLKLTNNTLDQEGHIILHSMHRYLPRLHIISADKSTDVISLSGPNVHTFTFPQTEFVAVTAYQNMRITQLKIDFNPFAKGFRDEGLNSRPMRELRHQGSESMDADCSDDSASCSSVATESSEHLRFKTEEESEHRKKQGNTHTFPNSSLDGGLSNTEDEDFLEEDMPKINNPCGEKSNMKKRSTESILKCLPNIYSTSSEDHEEPFNIIVKEEPPDDYEYNCAANSVDLDCGGLQCKEEEEYLDSEEQHDKTNYELINKTFDKNEVDATSPAVSKQPLKLPTEVAPKAKMLQLQSIKVPVVCLEPCIIPKGTIKISEIPQKLLSPCRRSGGPLPTIVHSPVSAEKHTCSPSSAEKPQVKNVDSTSECSRHKERSLASEITENKTHISTVENIPTASHSTPSGKSPEEGFRFRKIKFTEKARNSTLWMSSTRAYLNSTEDPPVLSNCFKSARLSSKAFSSGIWRPPDGRTCSTGETSMPRTNWKSSAMSTRQAIAGACRRRRTKKLRLSAKSSRSVLGMSSLASSKHLEREKAFQDASPDLDDVEGVTFVSYASQDALQSHLVEKMPEDQSSSIYPTADPQETEEEKIERLEEQLLENLAHLNPRVIMHPLLEQAGLKPSSLLSTGSLNLKHLGVVISPSASIIRTAQRDILKPSPIREVRDPSEEVSFVSRTGKTNDFTKLKGWKHKLAQQSESSPSKQVEASTNLEASMKNRSVFSSDKLDEYLENEEKIIKERAALCVNKMSKVVYEMPTKSSSYIRTLDSVLKQRATQANTRESPSSSRTSVSPQSIPAGSVSKSKKQSGTIVEHDSASKAQKSVNSAKVASTPAKSPAKSSRLRFSSSARRLPGISKKQMKLMHLENSALWSGKPRTYITEERAEASLVTLLTAQGSLSSRKRKMVSRQLPMCKNEFCRLGCICSSLSHVKQPPNHCRKPKCMLTCKCPKQKVLVLKSFARRKKQMNKALREDLIFYDALAEDEDWKPRAKKRKRKKMVRYAIPAREQPIRSYPMWVREEGEVDPEPVYTAPHIESCHADKTQSLPEESTPASSPKLSEVDEKGPVYWYFENMMTCARVRVFERKDAGKSLTCTCSPTQCCKEGNSKVNDNSAVAACKLKCCSDCKPSKESDPEKMDGLEDSSTSPNGVQKCEWKTEEKTDSPLRCNSPQGESSCFDPKEPPSTGQIKNTSKLIEIISDCNWESERTNILEVLARYTANKGISEKIRIGNFLVEIASNRGKDLDAPPGNTHISSSVVKITQPADKEEDVKNSGCNISVQTASKSSGLKLTDLRPIAPKEKLRIPANSTLGSKEITIIQLGSTVASQQKAASDTTARKNGLMQFTRSTSGDTKLTLGQVGALHPVNWVIANLKKNVKSAEPVKWFTSSMAASSISADLPSKHTTSCTTDPASEVSRDDTNAVPSDQTKGNYAAPDNYTHLVINKVGDVGKTKSCFSSLEPVSSNQQLGTLLCRVNMNATTGIPPLITGTSEKSTSVDAVSTNAGSHLLKSFETTDADESQFYGIPETIRIGEESIVTASTVETPARSSTLAVISASVLGVRTTQTITKLILPSASTSAVTPVTNTTILSMADDSPGLSKHPETSNSTPDLPKATKTEESQLISLPVQSGLPVRPVQNLQLTPGQKVILQPLRYPVGKLFQHPNGQIIQLVPLANSGTVSQPNLHQMITLAVRNPGSVSGICLPTPSQSSSAVLPILHPVSGIPTKGKPHSVPVKKYIRVPLKQISTIQSISSNVFEVPVVTTSPAKLVTVNDLGQTINTRHLIPLQPMGLALLQLPPGQKNVPSAIITTEWPLKFMNPPSKSKSPEKAGSKIANQDGNLEEQLIEPEEIHVADSDLIETTVSEGVPDEDHGNTYPLTEVKQGTECDVLTSTPSVSEVDNELEDDSTDYQNALEHIIPVELFDHSYTSERRILRIGRNKKSLRKKSETTEKSVDKDTSESCHEVVDKEPDEEANREVKNGVQDEQMEVETEVKESWYETTPFKREEDTLKDEENDEINFDPTLLQYADIHTESDKDTDSQSDLEDGDIQTDAEEIDVEKMFDSTSSEEAVDIETVEELSEKINIARLIASASHHHTRKTKCHFHNPYLTRKSKEEYTKPKLKSTAHISKEAKAQLDALVLYRTTHTVNERRRRSKIRDLFERLKKVLGLRREERASKYLILKKAFSEIQNAQDYFDCLSAEKSIQTRRRDSLIRKVSQLTGKTDEVILKKLEYICAKQRALDAEKKKLAQKADDTRKKRSKGWNAGLNSSVDSFQKVAMDLRNQKPPNVVMQTSEQESPKTGTRKPLILTRKRSSAALYSSTTSNPTGGNLLMTPQGQVLTLKGPLISGQTSFFTAEGLLSGSQSKGDDATGTSIAGIASVTVQLQGLPVPLQVNNFAIAGSLSSGQSASAQLSTKPGMEAVSSDSADMRQGNNAKSQAPAGSVGDEASSFMMPRIVNVTSLATGEAPLMNVENMNNSFAFDTQPLDFSIKGRKRRILQERLSFTTSKIPSLSIVKNSSHPAGKSTVPDESEVTPCPYSSEAEESECAQTQQIVASRSLDADNISELPKALDLSSLSDGTAVSCTGQAWTQEAAPGESSTVTEIMLGDKLELQVIGGRMQTCSIDKAGQSDREAELSSSQLLEPLLKANGSAAGDMVDTEGYEPFTSLLNELAFLNQQFSDEENPDVSSVSDHNALGFIDSGNQGDSMDELSLIHGPVLVDIDSTDGTTELKQVAGRESGGSNSPLVLQLEEDDLNVEQLLGNEMPVDSQTELDNGTLDLEGSSISGSSSSVNISPPPLIHMKTTTSSANTGISSSLDMLWRPMPKLAPLGLAWGAGKAVSSVQVESRSEDSPETNKPMPALARISSPQQDSVEGPEFASGEH
ncbi:MAX dimerization protein MGA a isoform X1 [Hemitrygon akajei]|uniref:MAX dimerization protein MGA a isoform X1 n=1 Tax=Hemitrygon akajei TaxID=2704970 RepID=UPI003BF9C70F